jgi:hypothetical protein
MQLHKCISYGDVLTQAMNGSVATNQLVSRFKEGACARQQQLAASLLTKFKHQLLPAGAANSSCTPAAHQDQ